MNKRFILLFAAAFGISAMAAAQTASSEFTRNQNVPAAKQGTHASRSADRKAQRAEVTLENKAGEIKNGGEAGTADSHSDKLAGTHESRKAERKTKRGEIAAANKAGDIPVSNEAYVGKQKP